MVTRSSSSRALMIACASNVSVRIDWRQHLDIFLYYQYLKVNSYKLRCRNHRVQYFSTSGDDVIDGPHSIDPELSLNPGDMFVHSLTSQQPALQVWMYDQSKTWKALQNPKSITHPMFPNLVLNFGIDFKPLWQTNDTRRRPLNQEKIERFKFYVAHPR